MATTSTAPTSRVGRNAPPPPPRGGGVLDDGDSTIGALLRLGSSSPTRTSPAGSNDSSSSNGGDAADENPGFGIASPSESSSVLSPASTAFSTFQQPYMSTACAEVERLLEQITMKDSPPANDLVARIQQQQQQQLQHHNKQRGSSSQQQVGARHLDDANGNVGASIRQQSSTESPLTEIAGASSFETDASSGAGGICVSAFFRDYSIGSSDPTDNKNNKSNNGSSVNGGRSSLVSPSASSCTRMGHSSMVALCAWTLEQMQGSVPEPNVAVQQTTPTCTARPFAQPSKGSTNAGAPAGTKPKRKFPWNKKLVLSSSSSSSSDAGEEKKLDDGGSGAAPVVAAPITPRLQQFASEYARFLSNSQLAPQEGKNASHATTHSSPAAGGATTAIIRATPPLHTSTSSRRFARNSVGTKKDATSSAAAAAATDASTKPLEQADTSVLTGALLDLVITVGDEVPPRGYHRVTQTASGQPVPFGPGRRKSLFLAVKKETNWDKAAQRPTVTAVAVIFPDRGEFVPPGFCVVKNSAKLPANLNADATDAGAERVYLVFRRSRECNPLTGLVPLVPPEQVPPGYTVIEKTPRNHVANLNSKGRVPIFLAYRQRLANLEALRPLPLLRAAQPKAGADFTDEETESEQQTKLMAYYATGGSTVAANVGRFHILDRSTHSLLSPSSVQNRLALIQLSRRRSDSGVLDAGSVDADSTTNTATDHGDDSEHQRTPSMDHPTSTDEHGREEQPQVPIYVLSHFLKTSLDHPTLESNNGSNFYDFSLRHCLDAMTFIPTVQTAIEDGHQLQLQARCALLTPILTACYTRHGGAALLAVESLNKLLNDGFYQDDVELDQDDHESSRRLTLLDLSLQAVCDVATSSACETYFGHCADFLRTAVQFSQGQLNTRTIGYIVRFYFFVFYFGASVPNAQWPNPHWTFTSSSHSKKQEGNEDGANSSFSADDESDFDYTLLLDDPSDERGYLPGGAPQSAALALKELISLSIVRLGKVSVSGMVMQKQQQSQSAETKRPNQESCGIGDFLETVISGLIDGSVDHVERANYTQLAYYQIHRSGGSELFWHDMINTCGGGLFKDDTLGPAGRDIYIMIFAVLANLVKVSSGKMRSNTISKAEKGNGILARDTASKLLSFELLLHFLEFWNDEEEALSGVESVADGLDRRSVDTLAFSIRRMVVPSLLSNTRSALEDPQVFLRIIKIISELWSSPVYRKHCKVELGILMEHFALRVLQLGPQLVAAKQLDLWSERAHVSLLAQQVEVVKEIKNWFSSDPKDVIELFLNYDTDMCSEITGPIQLMPGTRWKIFQRICAGLSNIAEQCGEIIGKQISENQSKVMSNKQDSVVGSEGLSELLETLNDGAKDQVDEMAVREAARLLRRTSVETISQIVKSLAISAAASTGNEFTSLLLSWAPVDAPISYQQSATLEASAGNMGRKSPKANATHIGDDDVLRFWRDAIAADQQERLSHAAPSSQESLLVALEIAKRKSLKKAIEYLMACNALSPSPRDVANFCRINKDKLDPSALGIYLSEGGTGGADSDYWNSLRHLYVRAISFVGQTVEEGLVPRI